MEFFSEYNGERIIIKIGPHFISLIVLHNEQHSPV